MTDVALRPRQGLVRSRWFEAGCVALLPAVALVVLRASPYFRLNNGDPFIYVGYSNAFEPIVRRFGYTYHAVRFGIIFPMRLSLIFGPVWGYFILRYLLYQLAIVPLYVVLRRRQRSAALFASIAFVCSPVAAESILTTYHDTFVVPCCTAMLCLLVLACRHRGWRMWICTAAAGALAGWGVNANISFGPLVALVALVALGRLLLDRRWREAIGCSLLFLVAFAAVCGLGLLVYDRDFGDPNIYETTINAVRDISGSSFWRTPGVTWIRFRRYVFAPLFVLAVAGGQWWRGRRSGRALDREAMTILVATAVSIAYFWIQQFLLNAATLEQAYYFAYVLGPTCLLLGVVVSSLAESPIHVRALLFVGPIALAWAAQTVDLKSFLLFALLVVALVAAAISSQSASVVGLAVFAAMSVAWASGPRRISTSTGHFQYDPHYEIAFGGADRTAFDAYVIASRLPHVVPSGAVAQPPLLFWYASGDALLDSVQSTFLWQNSTVQRGTEPGMPNLADVDIERLRSIDHGYVVQLARTPASLDAGAAALVAAGFGHSAAPDVTLRSGSSRVYLRILTLTSSPSMPKESSGP